MTPRAYHFTGGMPDSDSFPAEKLAEAAQRAILREGGELFVRYPGDQGNWDLREAAARRFNESQGGAVSPDDVAITNGSMQALDLIIRAYVPKGGVVLTEQLTYMGTLGILRYRGARIAGVPMDESGMDVDALSEMLDSLRRSGIRPSLINTVPVNHNPTGAHLSADRKARMLELAEEHDVPILEDDCYGDIYFDGEPPPAMYASAEPGRVLYAGTFSKTIGPGMRLGYLIAPPLAMRRVMNERWDGGTSAFASVILAEFLREHMWEHIRKTNKIAHEKRDALLDALDGELGGSVHCEPPKGGLFAWVKVPDETDMAGLSARLEARRVYCTRGRAFDAGSVEIPFVRFSFAYPSLEDIRGGVAAFAECLRESQPSKRFGAGGV